MKYKSLISYRNGIGLLLAALLGSSAYSLERPGYRTSVLSAEEGRALGQKIANAGSKVKLNLTDLSSSGVISPNSTFGGFQIARPLGNLLNSLMDQDKAITTLSIARKGDGFHGFEGSLTSPALPRYIVSAIDISSFENHPIDILHPEEAAEGIVALINSLPAGHYELGIPRKPYSLDRPESSSIDAVKHCKLRTAVSSACDPATGKFRDPDSFTSFYPSDKNSSYVIDANGKQVTGVQNQLNYIGNPDFRARIKEAAAAAEARGAHIDATFPDALDHLHLTAIHVYRPFDFTGDGHADILWRNLGEGEARLGQPHFWEMNGTARQSGMWSILSSSLTRPNCYDLDFSDAAWQGIGASDVNQDKMEDLVYYNTITGVTAILYMNGPVVTTCEFIPLNSGAPDTDWKIGGVGDFTGDGHKEYFKYNTRTFQTSIRSFDGNPSDLINPFTWDYPRDDLWLVSAIGDMDGNKTADVVWRHRDSPVVSVWFSEHGLFTHHAEMSGATPGLDWMPRAIADYDHDGKPDILWRNASTGELAIGTFQYDKPSNRFIRSSWSPLFPILSDLSWTLPGAENFVRLRNPIVIKFPIPWAPRPGLFDLPLPIGN